MSSLALILSTELAETEYAVATGFIPVLMGICYQLGFHKAIPPGNILASIALVVIATVGFVSGLAMATGTEPTGLLTTTLSLAVLLPGAYIVMNVLGRLGRRLRRHW